MIPRALGSLLGRIGAAQNISQTQRKRDLDKHECCHWRMESRENIPILREADKAVWIRLRNQHILQSLAQPLPSVGSSWCCPMGNYPPEHSELEMPGPTRHKHSTQITNGIFLVFLQNQQIFIALEVGREQKLATGKA